ncbi:hypothetical protein GTP23_12815 [Pseudoduganella sp. FT93W]|uniref:Uncharacterized protein n=1 Tax=Duganella fentianensis TaxID=2692177 RepID=A0A845HXN1_9BURK|nr:hypothetical protein [Duganella fentianensis]MYN45930.1 hypothetical protein [Duganella fentianensis]
MYRAYGAERQKMNVVYFPDEIAERAPDIFSSLCIEPSGEFLSIQELIAAIVRRENVNIRPATETEIKRAEAYVALFEIGMMLGEKLNTLFDQDAPNVAVGKLTELREAVESCDWASIQILDKKLEV